MDQDAFRQTYREVNAVYCAFEKSVLTNECQCACADRFCIAEREGVHCRDARSQARCLRWLELLREQARFALRTDQSKHLLPHGKAIRLQVGGMRGLGRVLDDDIDATADGDRALGVAEQRFGGLDALPFADIMQDIAAYQIRNRSRRRR